MDFAQMFKDMKEELVQKLAQQMEIIRQELKSDVSEMVNKLQMPSSSLGGDSGAALGGSRRNRFADLKDIPNTCKKESLDTPAKKKKLYIYSTPSCGPHNVGLKRKSLSEPRGFGSKRQINFMDFKFLEDNLHGDEDTRLLKFIFNKKLPESEILAWVDDCQCSRKAFDTLRPAEWIDDMVISVNIAMMKHEEQKNHLPEAPRSWFLPTFFEPMLNAKPNWSAEGIYDFFLSPERHGAVDFIRTHKVFLVLNQGNMHWFVCVIDLLMGKIFIIETLHKIRLEDRRLQVEPLLKRLHAALEYGFPDSYLYNILQFPCEFMDHVAKQNNGYDCGLLAIHFMRAYAGIDNQHMADIPSSEALRKVYALRMVKHDVNKVKNQVLGRF